MNTALKASLEEAIQAWMDDNCESPNWIDSYVSEETARLMADAAATVLEAVEEAQLYLVREGYLED